MASKRLQQESFRKRKNNFIRRGHEISSQYKVAVWICIQKDNGQIHVYNSDPTRSDWPPSSTQLVGSQSSRRVEGSNVVEIDVSRSQPAKRDTSLPGYLSRPPVPEYSQEEIFSGRLSEGRGIKESMKSKQTL